MEPSKKNETYNLVKKNRRFRIRKQHVMNSLIDITMEVRRLKKPGSWPGLNPISVDNVDDLIATEFVAPAAWTGARPHEEMLGKHLEKAEIDMFR